MTKRRQRGMGAASPADDGGRMLEEAFSAILPQLDAGAPLQALPWPQQVVLVVYAAQGVIDNGGLQYFFESDWPGNPPYSLFVEAYTAIGAQPVADCIEAAVAQFPFPDPHLDSEARQAYMDSEKSGEDAEAFAEFSDPIMEQRDSVFARLAEYVRAHEADIRAS